MTVVKWSERYDRKINQTKYVKNVLVLNKIQHKKKNDPMNLFEEI